MLKKALYIVFSVSILLILTSCSRDFDKLLKSDDYGLKLEKAYEYFEAEKSVAAKLTKGYGGGQFSWTAACALDLIST
mgnify:CR=1 FL=1